MAFQDRFFYTRKITRKIDKNKARSTILKKGVPVRSAWRSRGSPRCCDRQGEKMQEWRPGGRGGPPATILRFRSSPLP
jgi:hypothetical protein